MSFKRKNLPWLSVYVGLHVVTLWWLVAGTPLTANTVLRAAEVDWTKAAVAVAFGLLTLVLNGFGDPGLKAALVFRRWRHPLPGTRAFFEVANADPRIDAGRLRCRHRPSLDPAKQNELWYSIYQRHRANESVGGGHQDYLLFRDLTWITALLGSIGGTGAIVFAPNAGAAWSYIGASVCAYVLLAWVASRAGERFVATVLAVEAAHIAEESGS